MGQLDDALSRLGLRREDVDPGVIAALEQAAAKPDPSAAPPPKSGGQTKGRRRQFVRELGLKVGHGETPTADDLAAFAPSARAEIAKVATEAKRIRAESGTAQRAALHAVDRLSSLELADGWEPPDPPSPTDLAADLPTTHR